MTTAAGGLPEKRLFDRVALWCHHHEPSVWTTWALTGIVIAFAFPPETRMTSGYYWVALAVQQVVWAGIPLAFVGGRLHMRKFWDCAFCFERQPLDAPAQGEKHRKTLVAFHQRRRVLTWMGLSLVALVGGTIAANWLFGPPWGSLLILAPLAALLWVCRAARLHSQLQPWCPICRRRDEDDDPIDVPVPTPPSAKVEA